MVQVLSNDASFEGFDEMIGETPWSQGKERHRGVIGACTALNSVAWIPSSFGG